MRLHELQNLEFRCPACKAVLDMEKVEWGVSGNLSEVTEGTETTCWACLHESPARRWETIEGRKE